MSDVVWCDYGGHFMSANDPDREFFTQPDNQYGQDQRKKRIDTCGLHRAPMVEFPTMEGIKSIADRLNALETPALMAEKKGYDPEYVKWLEDQANKPIVPDLAEDLKNSLKN